jgi:hypothetical protein
LPLKLKILNEKYIQWFLIQLLHSAFFPRSQQHFIAPTRLLQTSAQKLKMIHAQAAVTDIYQQNLSNKSSSFNSELVGKGTALI